MQKGKRTEIGLVNTEAKNRTANGKSLDNNNKTLVRKVEAVDTSISTMYEFKTGAL